MANWQFFFTESPKYILPNTRTRRVACSARVFAKLKFTNNIFRPTLMPTKITSYTVSNESNLQHQPLMSILGVVMLFSNLKMILMPPVNSSLMVSSCLTAFLYLALTLPPPDSCSMVTSPLGWLQGRLHDCVHL